MVDEPFLSVIIPCVDDPRLFRCLRRLRECKGFAQAEVLICLNGSSKGFKDRVATEVVGIENIVIHTLPFCSISSARNVGIIRARSKKMVFIDSDCTPMKGDYLLRIAAALDFHSIVSGDIRFVSKRSTIFSNAHCALRSYDYSNNKERFFFCPNIGFHKDVLDKVGLYDERLKAGEDAELGRRLSKQGFHARHVSEALLIHEDNQRFSKTVSTWCLYGLGKGFQVARHYRLQELNWAFWKYLLAPIGSPLKCNQGEPLSVLLLRPLLSLCYQVGVAVGYLMYWRRER